MIFLGSSGFSSHERIRPAKVFDDKFMPPAQWHGFPNVRWHSVHELGMCCHWEKNSGMVRTGDYSAWNSHIVLDIVFLLFAWKHTCFQANCCHSGDRLQDASHERPAPMGTPVANMGPEDFHGELLDRWSGTLVRNIGSICIDCSSTRGVGRREACWCFDPTTLRAPYPSQPSEVAAPRWQHTPSSKVGSMNLPIASNSQVQLVDDPFHKKSISTK